MTPDALRKLVAGHLGGAGENLLGGAPSAKEVVESEREHKQTDRAAEFANYVVQCLVNGYADGEVTFHDFCSRCHDALAVEAIPPYVRQKLLGAAVEFALSWDPPKRASRKARPMWLAELCHLAVLDIVKNESLPLVRESKTNETTAFERAVKVLAGRGIKGLTPTSVEKARAQWGKAHTGTR